jgi:hypothetical protein
VPVARPRVRAADGSGELPVPSYELFAGTEILGAMAMERMLHRVDALTAEIATVQSRIDARVAALADTVTPLDAIPGVAQSPRRRSWPRPGSTWAGSRPGRLDSAGDLHHLECLRPARAGADRG